MQAQQIVALPDLRSSQKDQSLSTAHEPTQCVRDVRTTLYVGKGWKSRFACPKCGRACWQHLNFLGRRVVVCDGVKFSKVSPEGL